MRREHRFFVSSILLYRQARSCCASSTNNMFLNIILCFSHYHKCSPRRCGEKIYCSSTRVAVRTQVYLTGEQYIREKEREKEPKTEKREWESQGKWKISYANRFCQRHRNYLVSWKSWRLSLSQVRLYSRAVYAGKSDISGRDAPAFVRVSRSSLGFI